MQFWTKPFSQNDLLAFTDWISGSFFSYFEEIISALEHEQKVKEREINTR